MHNKKNDIQREMKSTRDVSLEYGLLVLLNRTSRSLVFTGTAKEKIFIRAGKRLQGGAVQPVATKIDRAMYNKVREADQSLVTLERRGKIQSISLTSELDAAEMIDAIGSIYDDDLLAEIAALDGREIVAAAIASQKRLDK